MVRAFAAVFPKTCDAACRCRKPVYPGKAVGAAMIRYFVLAVLLAFAAPAAAMPACQTPPGVETLWSRPGTRFVLFGEIHGTAESPKLFGEVVCAALRSGRPVVAALEIPERHQLALDVYLESEGRAAERQMLTRHVFKGAFPDGRASRAMFDLIERLRVLRQQGADLHLWASVPEPNGGLFEQSRYEAAMAARLSAAGQGTDSALVLALMGDLHARINTDAYGANFAYAPAGNLLPRPATLAVDLVGEHGGTAWNCQTRPRNDKPDCGAHDMRFPPGSRQGLTLFAEPQNGFDAALGFDHATASPPVIP